MAGKSNLDADQGNVGSHFTEDGKIGGTAQKVGGPFDKVSKLDHLYFIPTDDQRMELLEKNSQRMGQLEVLHRTLLRANHFLTKMVLLVDSSRQMV